MTHVSEADMAAVHHAMSKSRSLPPWARGATTSPVINALAALFPDENRFVGFMNMSDEEFNAACKEDTQADDRRHVLLRGLMATINGDDDFRIPRCMELKHSAAYRRGFILLAPFGATSSFLQLGARLMIHNLRREAAGAFEKDDDPATASDEQVV